MHICTSCTSACAWPHVDTGARCNGMVPGGARWRYVSGGDDDVRRTSRYVDAGVVERGFNFRGDRNAAGFALRRQRPGDVYFDDDGLGLARGATFSAIH